MGLFAGIFAIIGCFRYYGDPQFGGFVLLVCISWIVSQLVKGDYEANGVEGGNKVLDLSGLDLQIVVIVRGIQSFAS